MDARSVEPAGGASIRATLGGDGSEHADEADVDAQRLAGERVIEVERRPVVVEREQGPGDPAPVGGQHLDRVARRKRVARRAAGAGAGTHEGAAADPLQQRRIALAVGLCLAEFEARIATFGKSDQACLDRVGHLAYSQLQRRRLTVEGVDHHLPGGQQRDTVMERQVRTRLDLAGVGIGHDAPIVEAQVCVRPRARTAGGGTPGGAPPGAGPKGAGGLNAMPIAERPREKLIRHGVGALCDAELLALLIRSGTARHSALDIARLLLDRHGALAAVLASPLERLGAMPGLGIAKAASLVAAMELARRAQFESIDRQTLLDKPQAVRRFLALLLNGRDQEAFVVMFLDSQNRLIRCDEMFRGTLNQTAVYPRDIVRRALDLHAGALIVAHNHPSGLAEPSQADLTLTTSLKAALAAVGIAVLDHLIVAGAASYSFAEQGRL